MDPSRAQPSLTQDSDATPNFYFNFDLGPGFSKPQEIQSLKEQSLEGNRQNRNNSTESPQDDKMARGGGFEGSLKELESLPISTPTLTSLSMQESEKCSPSPKANRANNISPLEDLEFLLDDNLFKANQSQRPTSAGNEPFLMGAKATPIGDPFGSPAESPSSNNNNNHNNKLQMTAGIDRNATTNPHLPSRFSSEVSGEEVHTSSSCHSRECLADILRSGGDYEALTTELEGLRGPPKGLQMATAIGKGKELYEKGLYPNAIMWLSWAEALMPKEKPISVVMDVIGCRVACFKQIGEYKKAILDCTKALDLDERNVPMLMTRANLYECIEDYKNGAADLSLVLRIEPRNQLANVGLTRLKKLTSMLEKLHLRA